MTLADIYSKIAAHMVEGIMVHEQLMNCYRFFGLEGYAKCHEYHYLSETKGYIRLCKYFMDHHRGLIKVTEQRIPDIIPSSWYECKKDDMTTEVLTQGVRAAFSEWVSWEEETLKLYESLRTELISIGEIASALFMEEFIRDVDDELLFAKEERLKKSAIAFDMVSIFEEQEAAVKDYSKRLRKLW